MIWLKKIEKIDFNYKIFKNKKNKLLTYGNGRSYGDVCQNNSLINLESLDKFIEIDQETNILKYYQDRSLYLTSGVDTTDTSEITTKGQLLSFESSANQITAGGGSGFQGSIDTSFGGSTLSLNDSIVGLGVTFSQGLAEPEINKSTGDIIYIDNRSIVTRSNRQKEDVKIILEF